MQIKIKRPVALHHTTACMQLGFASPKCSRGVALRANILPRSHFAYARPLAEIFLFFSGLTPNCFKRFPNFFFFYLFIGGNMVFPPLRSGNNLLIKTSRNNPII